MEWERRGGAGEVLRRWCGDILSHAREGVVGKKGGGAGGGVFGEFGKFGKIIRARGPTAPGADTYFL